MVALNRTIPSSREPILQSGDALISQSWFAFLVRLATQGGPPEGLTTWTVTDKMVSITKLGSDGVLRGASIRLGALLLTENGTPLLAEDGSFLLSE